MLGLTAITYQVNAQNQDKSDIEERLIARGVPIKQVTIRKRIPYEIEIDLQSSSEDSHFSTEDRWNMLLANREATMAYRIGTRVKSYILVIYNTKGEQIYSGKTFLYPDDLSQKIPESRETKIENTKTKEIISSQLNLDTLKLDSLNVTSENIDGFTGQIVDIQVSTKDWEQAKQLLPRFIGKFFNMEETLNDEYGTNVVLFHLCVFDNQGNLIFDHARDLESGNNISSTNPDLFFEWLSNQGEDNKKQVTTASPVGPYPSPILKEASPEPIITTPYP